MRLLDSVSVLHKRWKKGINIVKGLLFPLLCFHSSGCLRIPGSPAPVVFGFNKPIEPALGEFPFQASLMQLLDDKKSYHSFCGGSLIHPEWILTAAHCIRLDETAPAMKASEVYVALGSIYRSARGAQIIRAATLKIHPQYLSSGGRNDIGLIKLRRPAKLGKNVKLIKLHHNNGEDLQGRSAYLTGFGIINDFYQMPERLRKATLKVSSYKKCYNDVEYEDKEICGASTVEQGKACKGDSGGPLTVLQNNKLIQIGITSRLALLPFCRIGFNHSIYTRVSAYIKWISKVTGINFSKFTS
ncbi:PREDICTED: mite allergen Der p 3-like [Nicrophorus vespilloides]|uniref:Mite allergen Der p 3-like n=1 Tax=Nicrophorus vespilloides TaxID=110193 RepID=A0ABM1MNG2_NICVS|nr:PREDICTED: mite allergen Der p 3-like [Nicrophorus vespilloides]